MEEANANYHTRRHKKKSLIRWHKFKKQTKIKRVFQDVFMSYDEGLKSGGCNMEGVDVKYHTKRRKR